MLRRPVIIIAAVLSLVVSMEQPKAQQAARGLVGSWILDRAEVLDGGSPTAVATARGLIVFDAAGNVIEILTRADRDRYAKNPSTPDEALVTFNNYHGFWGKYSTDTKAGTIAYRPTGAVNPNLMNIELERSYTLDGDQLTITSPAGELGGQGGRRWSWRRVPTIENLTPAYRELLGFWQWVGEGSYLTSTGAAVTEGKRDPSVIVYAPSGYVPVHFLPGNRKPLAGPIATAEEARAAIVGYVSYIAVLGLYPGHLVHYPLIHITPGNGPSLERDYEVHGDQVHLKFTPTTMINGQERQTRVTLKRLSNASDMLGQ